MIIPIPIPKNKLPTIAILTWLSASLSTNVETLLLSNLVAGSRRHKENETSDDKCSGSKHCCSGTFTGSSRSQEIATSWDNRDSHSASHFALFHKGSLEDKETVSRWDAFILSTAHSTSRQRRKRSAASYRSEESVSGERKRPFRRAAAERGLNEDM
jgi:hypothetical protein